MRREGSVPRLQQPHNIIMHFSTTTARRAAAGHVRLGSTCAAMEGASASARPRLARADALGGGSSGSGSGGGALTADALSSRVGWRLCAEGGACAYRPPRRATQPGGAVAAVASGERSGSGCVSSC
jgi:hypothetical protein